jgi:hypothetical protein
MEKSDLSELLKEDPFSPFVITTFDGFSFAIGPEEHNKIHLEAEALRTLDADGNVIRVLYRSIARIEEGIDGAGT